MLWCYAFDAGVDGYSDTDVVDADADADAFGVYAFDADAGDAVADAFCVYAFDAGIGVYSGADVVDADAGADVFVYICIGKLRQKVSYLSLHLKVEGFIFELAFESCGKRFHN